MTTNHKNSEPDLLDRATEALRSAAVAPAPGSGRFGEPPAHVTASTIEAVERELQTPTGPQRLRDWRSIMIRTAKLSAAAMVVLGAVLAAVLLTTGGPALAFADVQKQIEQLRSAQFKADLKLGDQPAMTSTLFVTHGGLVRHEVGREGQTFATEISDLNQVRSVRLEHASKIARVRRNITLSMPVNPLAALQDMPAGEAEMIRRENINGKETVVYRIKGANLMGLSGAMTVWVDPQTKLPVKVQAADEAAPAERQTRMTFYDFQWNPPLDPSLFSLNVPEGYKVVEDLDMQDPGALIVHGLRAYADLSGGTFPDQLDAQTHERLEQHIRQSTGTWPVRGGLEKMLTIASAGRAAERMKKQGHDWHYAGKGRKLGDGKPLAWFKTAADSDTYEVIFGDLSTGKLQADQLPGNDR